MNRKISLGVLTGTAMLLFSTGLLAQEKTEVTIQIKKNGEVIKDTTYQFDDASEAKNALKMMEILSEDGSHMGKYQYNYTMSHADSDQTRTMVFISEDGEHTNITELHGDSLVWIKEGDDLDFHGKHVIVTEGNADGTYNILIEGDDDDLGDMKERKIKVMVSEDGEGNWHVSEDGGLISEDDENVYILKGDQDVKVELKKILEEEEDGDGTKVIIIKKQVDKDQDADLDKDVDVDVKVIKKKKIEIEED